MATKKDISSFLKSKRVDAGLTQLDVARKLGYGSSQFISNWERGLANPPAFVLKDLAKLYKLDPKELLEMLLSAVNDKICKEFKRS